MNLSKSEKKVADMVVDGKSNEEIADALGIGLKTVKYHLTNVYAKESVQTRAQLIVKKLRENTLPSADEIKAFREILK